jgi:hypothetical protein
MGKQIAENKNKITKKGKNSKHKARKYSTGIFTQHTQKTGERGTWMRQPKVTKPLLSPSFLPTPHRNRG